MEILTAKGEVILVDEADYALAIAHIWHVLSGPKRATGYTRTNVYKMVDGKRKQRGILLHRLLLKPAPGQHVDHINGNGLDNRRSNLRLATAAQNMRNYHKRKTATSKYKGVKWKPLNKAWEVTICKDYKREYIGIFKSEIEAAKAYNARAIELHGEFARLNEVD